MFSQHMLPSSVTGRSPAELMFKGRKLPSHLDQLHPALTADIQNKQYERYMSVTPSGPSREFSEGSPVYVRNYARGDNWVPAEVTKIKGPLQYSVQDLQGRQHQRHVDQMRRRSGVTPVHSQPEPLTIAIAPLDST